MQHGTDNAWEAAAGGFPGEQEEVDAGSESG